MGTSAPGCGASSPDGGVGPGQRSPAGVPFGADDDQASRGDHEVLERQAALGQRPVVDDHPTGGAHFVDEAARPSPGRGTGVPTWSGSSPRAASSVLRRALTTT